MTLHYYQHLFAVALIVSTVLPSQVIHKKSEQVPPGVNILWTNPGDVASLDFESGVGGSEGLPQPPFRFVNEDISGTAPKVNVTDSRGKAWNVKFGHEVHASVFCSRLLWACGYFAETEYFIAHGRIDGVHGLKRAGSRIHHDGSFEGARFQLRADAPKYLSGRGWTWNSNPFSGTRELQGLKVLTLLVSNWDTKDARDFVWSKGKKVMDSNLAIFEDNSAGNPRHLYASVDWGASLGMWSNGLSFRKWDCKAFSQRTPTFVKHVKDGQVQWGLDSKHRKDVAVGIRVDDVRWLLQYLGKVSDEQIRSGLAASGATPEETACYTQSLRQRIEQLQRVANEIPRPR